MNWLRAIASMMMLLLGAGAAVAADGLIVKPSPHDVATTIERFEAAVKQRGFTIFARLDHAAAATSVDLKMPPAIVTIFGNPRAGTPAFLTNPTLAIDLPLKALAWQDKDGKTWLGYNAAAYVFGTLYPRHGLSVGTEARDRAEGALAAAADEAVRP